MSSDREQPIGSQPQEMVASGPSGLAKVGDDDATKLPDEEKAIELPIEEGDFNAQPT